MIKYAVFLIAVAVVTILSSTPAAADCSISGYLTGVSGKCNKQHDAECCVAGKQYPQYRCSPPITGRTAAILTLNSFQEGGDGGGKPDCDHKWHKDKELVVALSTGWYANKQRCLKYINIYYNGKAVKAKVVDECDSVNGCDKDHDYQPPCRYNIIDGSPAVWKALGIHGDKVGDDLPITWSDA